MQINQIRIQNNDFRVPRASLDRNYQLKLCNKIAPRWNAAEREEELGICDEIASFIEIKGEVKVFKPQKAGKAVTETLPGLQTLRNRNLLKFFTPIFSAVSQKYRPKN